MARLVLGAWCAVLAILLAFPFSVSAQLVGSARVTDGDTLRIGAQRIRLHGIDAPESKQTCRVAGKTWPCGAAATRALRERIAGRPITCEERDRDRYGRIVAVCRLAGEDVNAWMVSQGWALAYQKYSSDYVAQETAAKAARRGVWRGDFVSPGRWRRGEGLEAIVNGGGIMLHARRPGGPVAAAQNCATHGPLSVATRGRRCTAWSSMRRFDWRLSTRV